MPRKKLEDGGQMGLDRGFLKGLGMEDEAINSVMAEYGKTLNSHTEALNKLKGENLGLQEKVLKAQNADELDKQLKALQLEKEQWVKDKAQMESDSNAKIKDIRKNYAIRSAIAKSAPIDEVAYMAHLDMAKIEYDDATDALKGFEEQDKDIKTKYGFLFNGGAEGAEHGGIDSQGGVAVTMADAVDDFYK